MRNLFFILYFLLGRSALCCLGGLFVFLSLFLGFSFRLFLFIRFFQIIGKDLFRNIFISVRSCRWLAPGLSLMY